MKIHVTIPASTSNLGPGFDTLGMALTLYNELSLSPSEKPGERVVEVDGVRVSPVDAALAINALDRTWRVLGFTPKGFHLSMTNRVPMGRGLGSSGATVIGAIKAAAAFAGKTIANQQALAVALEFEGHPDNITPSLVGGITVSATANGQVEFLKIPTPVFHEKGISVVAVVPRLRLATSMAREILPTIVPLEDVVFNLNRTALLVASLALGNFESLREAVSDRLHQPYRAALIPGLMELIAAGYDGGALACFLSGAGPSIIALTARHPEQLGAKMAALWKSHGVEADAMVLGIDEAGARVEVSE
ncbi:MAG: homoserine kinase [Nitrospirota bacterium]|nr:homoserine kinase [Nitrospirota bacterium]